MSPVPTEPLRRVRREIRAGLATIAARIGDLRVSTIEPDQGEHDRARSG